MTEGLLREMVRELLKEVANLSAAEMSKRPRRWQIFLQKMRDRTPFEDIEGNKFIIPDAENSELVSALENQDPVAFKRAFAKGVKVISDDNRVTVTSPSSIKKTQEFGGLSPWGRLRKEQDQVAQIQSAIDEKSPIDINVGRKTALDVVGIESVKGTPKADAVLIDVSGDVVAAISLKYADNPSQMQQWGGITNYADHPEISAFIEDLKRVQASSPGGRIEAAYYRELRDANLARKLCYGDGSSVENNCDVIIASQDPIQIDSSGQIVATNVFYAPNIPPGEWKPTLWATSRSGRGAALGLQDVRVGAYPKGWGAGRKNKTLPGREDLGTGDADAPQGS